MAYIAKIMYVEENNLPMVLLIFFSKEALMYTRYTGGVTAHRDNDWLENGLYDIEMLTSESRQIFYEVQQ